ncbi:TnsD family Tn7-like transposition protein [Paenibacillus sp. GCM10023248]|uniref:TnsD family Tn7-like transposition protein n=1 Tax=unclassified Paenibacillus TaxID=185978 RepID=UPI002379475A|nr:TnsD family Tn7-like transposition protein [Paenibacillus sp. MAHUQ-63]MDD9267850.1 TnsD family Tn7-like transposition protein [Paenibacillus sp. MAHUQ-63]
MINFFPTPYPDEILYSILARYHIRSCNPGFKHSSLDLFGVLTNSSIILPSNITKLTANLPSNCLLTEEKIINDFTLFPIYAPFLDCRKAMLVNKNMKNGVNVQRKMGIKYGALKKNYLFYCSECLQQDLTHYGEGYWHRIHQVPGVFICPFHEVALKRSKLSVQDINDYQYLNVESEHLDIEEVYPMSVLVKKQLLNLSKNFYYLLNIKKGQFSLEQIQKCYLEQLKKVGLITPNGRIQQKKIQSLLLRHFEEETLQYLQLNIEDGVGYNASWMVRLWSDGAGSPVRHLLMMELLCGSVIEFFNQIKKIEDRQYVENKVILTNKKNVKTVSQNVNNDRRRFYREQWLDLQSKYPCYLRYQLREKSSNVYTWLYKNDKIWLNENSPERKLLRRTVNWENRDEGLIEEMKQVFNEWDEKTYQSRRSVKSVIKQLNKVSWFEKNAEKLPKSMAFLQAHVESVEDFQLRRAKQAIKILTTEKGMLKEWMVLRKANLPSNVSQRVRDFISVSCQAQSIAEYGN